jgi:phosphate:Na+ symporter
VIGAGAGLLMTFLAHSSSASTAIVLAMAYNNIINYEMAAGFILGANIGTTIDAALAGIGARTAAKQAALVHVLFNVIGTCWVLPLLRPLLALVHFITPGNPVPFDPAITTHLAMLHTVFNMVNTIIFLPFVKQFATLVSIIIRDDKSKAESGHYELAHFASAITDTPELNLIRVEKEIRDMAGIASSMYARFCEVLQSLPGTSDRETFVTYLVAELKSKEEYADEMRETLTPFLFEFTREQLNPRTGRKVSRMLRIIAVLEDMTDDCYGVSLLLERSVRKNRIFKKKEMDALIPYIKLVADFLSLVQNHLGETMDSEQINRAREIEANIVKSRDKLRKISRKRIEAGADVKTELLFIDLVRSIEKLGDNCYDIIKVVA